MVNMENNTFKSGFTALIGAPNVGKSTLLNNILGEKLAIVSPKPQTTRNRILGVYHGENFQIAFMDTPGIHKTKTVLHKSMVASAMETVSEVDILVFVIDVTYPFDEEAEAILKQQKKIPTILVINKIDTALPEDVITVRQNLHSINPDAIVIEAASPLYVDDPQAIRGKRVLVVEDGPTLTHGDMPYGAGWVAARRFGAAEIVDPRPYAVGSIRRTYQKYPATGAVLPAMGYGDEMVSELEQTINNADVDMVIIGTPIDLANLLKINKPSQRVRYELQEIGQPTLEDVLRAKFQE